MFTLLLNSFVVANAPLKDLLQLISQPLVLCLQLLDPGGLLLNCKSGLPCLFFEPDLLLLLRPMLYLGFETLLVAGDHVGLKTIDFSSVSVVGLLYLQKHFLCV